MNPRMAPLDQGVDTPRSPSRKQKQQRGRLQGLHASESCAAGPVCCNRWFGPVILNVPMPDLFSPAAFALLLLFFLGGLKQLVKSPKINRVRYAQVLADSPQGGGSGHLDDLNDVGSVLHAVRTQLGFHPPGDPCIAGAFANPQLLGAWDGGRCVLARLATFGNDINGDAFTLQFVPPLGVIPEDFNPVLGATRVRMSRCPLRTTTSISLVERS